MISTNHLNAVFYFQRDVKCIQRFFTKRFGLIFEGGPVLETDVEMKVDLATEIKASGFATQDEMQDFDKVNQTYLDSRPEAGDEPAEEEEQVDEDIEIQKEVQALAEEKKDVDQDKQK